MNRTLFTISRQAAGYWVLHLFGGANKAVVIK